MKLEVEPRISQGPGLYPALLDILRRIAQAVNTNDDAATTGAAQAGPTTQIAFFPLSAPPLGWLRANGATVSRTAYAALFAQIGTTFGVGDGSTTFGLPDLRDEFVRGSGGSFAMGVKFAATEIADQFGSSGTVVIPLTDQVVFNWDTSGTRTIGYNAGGLGAGATSGALISKTIRPRGMALLACIKY